MPTLPSHGTCERRGASTPKTCSKEKGREQKKGQRRKARTDSRKLFGLPQKNESPARELPSARGAGDHSYEKIAKLQQGGEDGPNEETVRSYQGNTLLHVGGSLYHPKRRISGKNQKVFP